jgi:hypothetical protein
MVVASPMRGIPGLIKLLLEVTLDGYKTIYRAQQCGMDISSCMLLLGIEWERLESWIQQLFDEGGDLSRLIDPTTKLYRVVLEVLSQMAGLFAQVENLESKYGIRRAKLGTGNEVCTQLLPLAKGDSTAAKASKRDVWRQKLQALRPGFKGVFLTGNSDSPLKKAKLLKLKAAASSILNPNRCRNTELDKCATDTDLEITVPRMPEVVQEIQKKAKIYQETLLSYRHFEWAFSTKEELESLIRDLTKYNDALIKLTAPFMVQGMIPPISQDPNKLPIQLADAE